MSNNLGVWCSKCYGDHYTNDCPKPDAPVEAKEKELCSSKTSDGLPCNALGDHEIHTHTREGRSDPSILWRDTPIPVAEPKPTPPTPADEPCEWYGRNVGPHDWINTPDGWKRCANCKREYKPQPDSSSISTAQTFDEWIYKHVKARDQFGFTYNDMRNCWNAAKGQS